MRATEADLLLITRILALAFAGFSTFFSLVALAGFQAMVIAAQGSTVISILALAGARARVGWRCAHLHPMTIATILLLLPAQLLILVFAIIGLRLS